MALIRPHINKKTGMPYTTSEYCGVILDIYKKALDEHNTNPNKTFVSPIGGVKDKEILDYCNYVMSIENIYQREQVAINALTNKEFLQMARINKELIR